MAVKAAGLREPEFIGGEVDLRINIYRGQVATNNAIINANGTKMVLMALIVAPMMELMALNVVKYYNEYELKRHQKRKESRFLFINSLLML